MISWRGSQFDADRMIMSSITDSGNNTFTRSLQISYLLESDENTTYVCEVTILNTISSESVKLQSLISKSGD